MRVSFPIDERGCMVTPRGIGRYSTVVFITGLWGSFSGCTDFQIDKRLGSSSRFISSSKGGMNASACYLFYGSWPRRSAGYGSDAWGNGRHFNGGKTN
jgi:hypothetical protein